VTLQIVPDWVPKFNAHGPQGLPDRKAPGQPSRLNGAPRAALIKSTFALPICGAPFMNVRQRHLDMPLSGAGVASAQSDNPAL
jgi:hypothetical protein